MNNIHKRIYRILCGFWRRRYTIFMPMLMFPILGLVVGLTSPKRYNAHTSMLIQETAKMNPFLEDLAVSSMLKERLEALKTLLHSRHILNEVAITLELVDDKTGDAERDAIISRLSNSLSMQMIGKDLIRIDHHSGSPDGMEAFLTTVSTHFIEQLLAPERSSIRDSAFFLKEHLGRRRAELESAEQELATFRSEHAEALPELHSMNVMRLSQLKQKLGDKESELTSIEKNIGNLDQLLSRTNPVVGNIEEKIVKIRSELALIRARYTDKHSKVQALSRALRRLESERQNILDNKTVVVDREKLWDMASTFIQKNDDMVQPILISQLENLQNAKNKADSTKEEISRLKSLIIDMENAITNFRDKEANLTRLTRDIDVKRELYEDILKRYEMAEVTGSLGEFEQTKRIKIIDRPFTPSGPSNLPLILFVIAGFFGGLFLGTGLAIVLEVSDSTIRYKQTFEDITNIPVISRIPPMAS